MVGIQSEFVRRIRLHNKNIKLLIAYCFSQENEEEWQFLNFLWHITCTYLTPNLLGDVIIRPKYNMMGLSIPSKVVNQDGGFKHHSHYYIGCSFGKY